MTPKGVTFENVEVGQNIPPLVKKPTTVGMFLWSAAMWNGDRIHYDYNFCRSRGFRDIVVQGSLRASYLVRMIIDWLGESATLRKLSYRHPAPAFLGDVLTCRGVIKDKRTEDGNGCLELDIWLENQDGQKVTTGTAIVYIPRKHSS